MMADRTAVEGVKFLRAGLHAAMTALLQEGNLKKTEQILRELDGKFGEWLAGIDPR